MTNGSPSTLLINCSNLHVGGAVAVATSFINCLSQQTDVEAEVNLLLSSTVHTNLQAMGTDLSRFAGVEVVDYAGFESMWRGLGRRMRSYDVVFTVFGPAYTLARPRRHVCGFAQPAIIFPNPPIEQLMSPPRRALERLKYLVHELFFARADELVVELEHVRNALRRKRLFRRQPIHIVYNTVDAIFRDPTRWRPVELPATPGALRLGVVSRNYVHKNLACLPALRERLAHAHGLAVDFFVTFTDAEWQACTPDFKANVRNVGALVLAQCPNFYQAMDGVVFPSLLECFSAVPLEAMMMRKPLFASDRDFIRDCCHEHAHYFDPLDTASMARTIATYFGADAEASRSSALDRACEHVCSMPDATDRAREYLAIACRSVTADAG